MQHGMVDLCIVGSDRTTAAGDVGNKIGTYLKALAAADNGVPFYAALPSSTIDWSITDGVAGIPIEERDATEVTHIPGQAPDGSVVTVRLTPRGHGGPQLRIRRDTGPSGGGHHHRARRGRSERGRSGIAVSRYDLRRRLVLAAQDLFDRGLNTGTAGNVSVRYSDWFLITPSGIRYDALEPAQIVEMDMEGGHRGPDAPFQRVALPSGHLQGPARGGGDRPHPSAVRAPRWQRCGAICPPSTTTSPAAGGTTIRCAPYATFGTQLLSDYVQRALEDRTACLLANHGMVAVGETLEQATQLAIEVEVLCQMYLTHPGGGRTAHPVRRGDAGGPRQVRGLPQSACPQALGVGRGRGSPLVQRRPVGGGCRHLADCTALMDGLRCPNRQNVSDRLRYRRSM